MLFLPTICQSTLTDRFVTYSFIYITMFRCALEELRRKVVIAIFTGGNLTLIFGCVHCTDPQVLRELRLTGEAKS